MKLNTWMYLSNPPSRFLCTYLLTKIFPSKDRFKKPNGRQYPTFKKNIKKSFQHFFIIHNKHMIQHSSETLQYCIQICVSRYELGPREDRNPSTPENVWVIDQISVSVKIDDNHRQRVSTTILIKFDPQIPLLKVNELSLDVASNPLPKTKEWIQRSTSTIKPAEGCYDIQSLL